MTTKLISRLDYLNKKATHEEYYAQFVTPYLLSVVKAAFPLEALREGLNEHFNNIPLTRWDSLVPVVPLEVAAKLKACGDSPTLAGSVCILKEAARQLVSSPNPKHL